MFFKKSFFLCMCMYIIIYKNEYKAQSYYADHFYELKTELHKGKLIVMVCYGKQSLADHSCWIIYERKTLKIAHSAMAPIANVRDNNSNSNSDSGSNSRGSHLRRSISHPRSESIRTMGPREGWSRMEPSGEWSEFATPFHPHAMCKSHTVAKNFDSYLRLAQKIRDMTCAEWSWGQGLENGHAAWGMGHGVCVLETGTGAWLRYWNWGQIGQTWTWNPASRYRYSRSSGLRSPSVPATVPADTCCLSGCRTTDRRSSGILYLNTLYKIQF